MKRLALFGVFVVASFLACPAPVPIPPPVTPADAACGVDDATHDRAVNAVVVALQDGTDLPVAQYTKLVVVCVVQEIVADTDTAPNLAATARHWLDAEGAP